MSMSPVVLAIAVQHYAQVDFSFNAASHAEKDGIKELVRRGYLVNRDNGSGIHDPTEKLNAFVEVLTEIPDPEQCWHIPGLRLPGTVPALSKRALQRLSGHDR